MFLSYFSRIFIHALFRPLFFSFESALFFLFSYGGLFFLRPLFALLFFFALLSIEPITLARARARDLDRALARGGGGSSVERSGKINLKSEPAELRTSADQNYPHPSLNTYHYTNKVKNFAYKSISTIFRHVSI